VVGFFFGSATRHELGSRSEAGFAYRRHKASHGELGTRGIRRHTEHYLPRVK